MTKEEHAQVALPFSYGTCVLLMKLPRIVSEGGKTVACSLCNRGGVELAALPVGKAVFLVFIAKRL